MARVPATPDKAGGLGLLSALPSEIRKLVYVYKGVTYSLCAISRYVQGELAPVLELYRHTLGMSGREVASYLLWRMQEPGQKLLLSGVIPSGHEGGVDVTLNWSVGSGKPAPRARDWSAANAGWHEWPVLLSLLSGTEREVLLKDWLAVRVLERRVASTLEGARERQRYAYAHYLRLLRREMDRVLLPSGYGIEHLLGFPVLPDTFTRAGSDVRVDRMRYTLRSIGAERLPALATTMRRFLTLYRLTAASSGTALSLNTRLDVDQRVMSLSRIAGNEMVRQLMVTVPPPEEGASGTALTARRARVTGVPRGKDVRRALDDIVRREGYTAGIHFARADELDHPYRYFIEVRRGEVRMSASDDEEDDLMPWSAPEDCVVLQAVFALLLGDAEEEVVVCPMLARVIYASDVEYGRALRQQMATCVAGSGLDLDDLLGQPRDDYRAASARLAALYKAVPKVGPLAEQQGRAVLGLKRLSKAVSVVVGKHVHDHGSKSLMRTVMLTVEALGLWNMLQPR
jgi:hypothetical protein